MTPVRIFISYRRSDAGGYAGRIYDRLAGVFGSDAVFMDTAAIPPGEDFGQMIDRRIRSSSVFLPIIGEDWLATDKAGISRLERADDPVRTEIETALEHKARIIPVLVGGRRPPEPPETCQAARRIMALNAVTVTNEMFEDSMRKLISAIDPNAPASVPKAGHSTFKLPRVLSWCLIATGGTVMTLWGFGLSPSTRDSSFSVSETLFVFGLWMLLIAATANVIRKTAHGRRSK